MKTKLKFKIALTCIVFLLLLNLFLFSFDKTITPTVMAVADAEMRAKSLEIINQCILEEYSKDFNYDDIIRIDKDHEGNVTMLKADTLKMNRIACNVAVESQKKLRELGNVGIKIPIGYIFRNNLLAYFGPSLTVKMQPIGQIETKYSSEFDSAGVNQTRHKIYVQVRTQVRVIIPTESNDIDVKNEIPISETIIVGKIPNTSINLDMQGADYKLQNK